MLILGGVNKADLCVFSFLAAIWHPQSDPRVQLEIPLFLRISLLWRVALFIRTLGDKGGVGVCFFGGLLEYTTVDGSEIR